MKGYGRAYSETGLILWRNPDRVVAPDVAFVSSKSLPVRTSPEGYLEMIPEFVAEIRSKGDSSNFIRRKVEHYLKAGVEIVWVVDPAKQGVTIHMVEGEPRELGVADVLTLPTIIPDFALPVADVFRA
jgi:Uma2 family endonuclease